MPRNAGIVREIAKGKGKIVYGSSAKNYQTVIFESAEDLNPGDLVTFNLQGDRALNVRLKRRR